MTAKSSVNDRQPYVRAGGWLVRGHGEFFVAVTIEVTVHSSDVARGAISANTTLSRRVKLLDGLGQFGMGRSGGRGARRRFVMWSGCNAGHRDGIGGV